MDRKELKKYVEDTVRLDWQESDPETLIDLIKESTKQYLSPHVYLNLEDEYTAYLVCTGLRPKTQEELTREAHDRKVRRTALREKKQSIEAEERLELSRLKAKYEGRITDEGPTDF